MRPNYEFSRIERQDMPPKYYIVFYEKKGMKLPEIVEQFKNEIDELYDENDVATKKMLEIRNAVMNEMNINPNDEVDKKINNIISEKEGDEEETDEQENSSTDTETEETEKDDAGEEDMGDDDVNGITVIVKGSKNKFKNAKDLMDYIKNNLLK